MKMRQKRINNYIVIDVRFKGEVKPFFIACGHVKNKHYQHRKQWN